MRATFLYPQGEEENSLHAEGVLLLGCTLLPRTQLQFLGLI